MTKSSWGVYLMQGICLNKKSKIMKCCYGISSDAGLKGQFGHTFFADADHVKPSEFIAWLKKVQDEWGLSNIYVIRTEHGLNACSCDIMPLLHIGDIQNRIDSPCDRDFFKYNSARGYLTLRFGHDKELLCILPSMSRKYVKSNALRLFLNWYFDIEIEPMGRFNMTTKVTIVQYCSDKNGHHQVIETTDRYEGVMRQ